MPSALALTMHLVRAALEGQFRISLKYWWKGRDSNPRPRHYELGAALKVVFTFSNLPRDVPLHLSRLSTTEHDRFPRNSRNAPYVAVSAP